MRLAFLAVSIIALALPACCEQGSGRIVKQTRQVEGWDGLVVDIPANLTVTEGPAGPIRIETDDNLIEQITTRTDGGELYLGHENACCIEPTALRVTLSTETLRSIRIDGSADITVDTQFAGEALDLQIDGSGSIVALSPLEFASVAIDIDGSGQVEVDVAANQLNSTIDGSGDLLLRGTAATHASDIDGSGYVAAFGLQTEATTVRVDGSGDLELSASERLEIHVDGSATIAYCGSPALSRDVDGSASIGPASAGRCP